MELLGLSRDEVLRRCFTHEPLVSAINEETALSQNSNTELIVQVVDGNDVAATPFIVKSKYTQGVNNISNCSSSSSIDNKSKDCSKRIINNTKQAHL